MRVKLARLMGIVTAAVVLGIGVTGQHGGAAADHGRGTGYQVLADDKGPASPKP
ncbi:hypothetical protein ACFRCW_44900 [Streptomyces sp. NPDC056653]|uniref:hypothetical protein n=1 Tax=Streptomyces sp. NPDC056653 TaxID=3345894 RepID=UPI0036C8BC85